MYISKKHVGIALAIILGWGAIRSCNEIAYMQSQDAAGASREFANTANEGLANYLQLQYDICVGDNGEDSFACEAIAQQIEEARGNAR